GVEQRKLASQRLLPIVRRTVHRPMQRRIQIERRTGVTLSPTDFGRFQPEPRLQQGVRIQLASTRVILTVRVSGAEAEAATLHPVEVEDPLSQPAESVRLVVPERPTIFLVVPDARQNPGEEARI